VCTTLWDIEAKDCKTEIEEIAYRDQIKMDEQTKTSIGNMGE
jgi:hypothetical protein